MKDITIDNIMAEMESTFKGDVAKGLIDKGTIIREVILGLKKFGTNISCKKDTVVEVKNGKAKLPQTFQRLCAAYLCCKVGYHHEPQHKDILIQDREWTERTERNREWNTCAPCCTTEKDVYIKERKFFRINIPCDYYYNQPTLLKLSEHMDKDACAEDCRNSVSTPCKDEISIKKSTLYTNFKKGSVYLVYYATPSDEKGLPIIPDLADGELWEYIFARLKYKHIEQKVLCGDGAGVTNLMPFYKAEMKEQYVIADSAIKMGNISQKHMNSLKYMQQQFMCRYDFLPKV